MRNVGAAGDRHGDHVKGFLAGGACCAGDDIADARAVCASHEWQVLPRELPTCLTQQHELMTMPVEWPGFHALCLESVDASAGSLRFHLHRRSGKHGDEGTRVLEATTAGAEAGSDLVDALLGVLRSELEHLEFQQVDGMISTSDYDFPPNPWALFTAVGGVVDSSDDLAALGAGAAVYLYTGGQFIWPGLRIGHAMGVPIPAHLARYATHLPPVKVIPLIRHFGGSSAGPCSGVAAAATATSAGIESRAASMTTSSIALSSSAPAPACFEAL